MILPKPAVAATPKFESWTSRFVKNSSLGAPREPSLQPYHLPVVELPSVSGALRPREELTCSSLQSLAAVVSEEPPVYIPQIPVGAGSVPASSVEFVPPPTVTRRPVRRELPPDYIESPLTRARRIDAQNRWREEQLRDFLTHKAGTLKSAMETLKTAPEPAVEEPGIVPPAAPVKRTSIVALLSNELIPSHPESEGVPLSRSYSDIASFENIMDITLPEDEPPASPNMRISDILNPSTIIPIGDALCDETSPTVQASQMPHPLPVSPAPRVSPPPPPSPPPATQASLSPPSPPPPSPPPPSSSPHISIAGTVAEEIKENVPERKSNSSTGNAPVDPAEVEKRRRLKERNDRALEKRRLLLQKAQQKAHPVTVPRNGASSHVVAPSMATKVPIARSASNLPVRVVPAKARRTSTSISASASTSLQKQAMVNNAIKRGTSPPQPASPAARDHGGGSGSFKLPLPKAKTPSRADHPASDDTFNIPLVESKTKEVASPRLPEIPTEYAPHISHVLLTHLLSILLGSSSDEDELVTDGQDRDALASRKDLARPLWALTPEVAKSLQQQRAIKPEDIFGEVQPVKLEGIAPPMHHLLLLTAPRVDFFKDNGKKYTRGRTSSIWNQ